VTREVGAGEEHVVLRVSDTGIGMSPEQIKRIFEEFAQGSAATTRRYGGTGLGLAITRSFCQLHARRHRGRQQPGRGSTFTVRLPALLTETRPRRRSTGPT
jgi:signal transduction histidine kinase